MSTLTAGRAAWAPVDRARSGAVAPRRPGAQRAPSSPDGGGGEPTLHELLVGVWERLAVHAAVACPLCGGAMEPEYAAHPLPVGGRCRDCGSTLS